MYATLSDIALSWGAEYWKDSSADTDGTLDESVVDRALLEASAEIEKPSATGQLSVTLRRSDLRRHRDVPPCSGHPRASQGDRAEISGCRRASWRIRRELQHPRLPQRARAIEAAPFHARHIAEGLMGVQMRVEAREIEALRRRMNELARLDTEPLMESVAGEIEEQAKHRIRKTKTAPDGATWEPWSPSYARRRESHHSLLEDTGDLSKTISGTWGERGAEIGSVLEYAPYHQTGTSRGGRDAIPARPFLGISHENENDIAALVDEFVEGAVRDAAKK